MLAIRINGGCVYRLYVSLHEAALNGHLNVVRELSEDYKFEGCGSTSGGGHALDLSAQHQHVDIMGMPTSTGVVDTGREPCEFRKEGSRALCDVSVACSRGEKIAVHCPWSVVFRLATHDFPESRLLVDAGSGHYDGRSIYYAKIRGI